jgi:mono/diheme cytochrome c family protein
MKVRYFWLFLLMMAPWLLVVGVVLADRNEHERIFSRWFKSNSMSIEARGGQRYQQECGSCHFPFQPGFLPKASWRLLISGLDDHFGENAELTDEDHQEIMTYLIKHAADTSDREISRKILWSIRKGPVPIRITKTNYFQHEHNEISWKRLQNNGESISFSNCDSCHRHALQGSYEEDDIDIPGYGRWDD